MDFHTQNYAQRRKRVSYLSHTTIIPITQCTQNDRSAQLRKNEMRMRESSAKLVAQLQLLPSLGLETRPSHTDNAWSAARRTNFRLSGLMVPGWSVDASKSNCFTAARPWSGDPATADVQETSLHARSRPAHKISNFLKYDQAYDCSGWGNPPAPLNDSWFNSVRFLRAQEDFKSAASRKSKCEKKCGPADRVSVFHASRRDLRRPQEWHQIEHIAEEHCCPVSGHHVRPRRVPQGPKAASSSRRQETAIDK